MKLVLSVLLATVVAATAQDDKLYPTTWKLPTKVVLPPHDRENFRKWCEPFYPGYPIRAVLHAVVRKSGATYVVFSTDEPRDERHIQWVAIRHGELVGYQRHTLQSSWRPTSGTIDGWSRNILSWHAEGGFTRGDDIVESYYAAYFDTAAPDKGFQVKETHSIP